MSQIGVPTKNLEEILMGPGSPETVPGIADNPAQTSTFILGQNLIDDKAQRLLSRPTSDVAPIANLYADGLGLALGGSQMVGGVARHTGGFGQPDEPLANTKTGTLTPSVARDPNGNRIIDSVNTFTTLTTGGPFDTAQIARGRALKQGRVYNGTVLGAPKTTGFGAGYGAMSGGTPGGTTTAALIVQDLTYTAKIPGLQGGAISIAYTTGATAGAEVVTVLGNAISVQIGSGTSTATQVRTALLASLAASALVTVTISGTGSNPQTAAAAAYLTGGTNTPCDGDGVLSNTKGSFSAINRVGSRNHASINVIARPGDTVNAGFLY